MDETKLYVLHCNKCNYKRFSNGKDVKDLLPLKLSDIPRNIPKLDMIKKKAVMAPDKKRLKMFKCPQCGFTVKPYLVDNNPEEEKENSDEQTN